MILFWVIISTGRKKRGFLELNTIACWQIKVFSLWFHTWHAGFEFLSFHLGVEGSLCTQSFLTEGSMSPFLSFSSGMVMLLSTRSNQPGAKSISQIYYLCYSSTAYVDLESSATWCQKHQTQHKNSFIALLNIKSRAWIPSLGWGLCCTSSFLWHSSFSLCLSEKQITFRIQLID